MFHIHSPLTWLVLAAVIVYADAWTKQWAVESLVLYRPVEVSAWLNWTLAHNYGAAFSILNDAGGWQRWFFVVLALVVTLFLMVWLFRLQRGEWRTGLALSLVLPLMDVVGLSPLLRTQILFLGAGVDKQDSKPSNQRTHSVPTDRTGDEPEQLVNKEQHDVHFRVASQRPPSLSKKQRLDEIFCIGIPLIASRHPLLLVLLQLVAKL